MNSTTYHCCVFSFLIVSCWTNLCQHAVVTATRIIRSQSSLTTTSTTYSEVENLHHHHHHHHHHQNDHNLFAGQGSKPEDNDKTGITTSRTSKDDDYANIDKTILDFFDANDEIHVNNNEDEKRSKTFNPYEWHRCDLFDEDTSFRIYTSVYTCHDVCQRKQPCRAFQYIEDDELCVWIINENVQPIPVTQRVKKIWCAIAVVSSESPSSLPSFSPLSSPSTLPSKPITTHPSNFPTERNTVATNVPSSQPSLSPLTYLTEDNVMVAGEGVSFVTNNNDNSTILMESASSSPTAFGVVITSHSFNASDIDFQVDYNQSTFEHMGQTGYESQMTMFFAPTGTYPETLLQSDNDFGLFQDTVVSHSKSKIWTSETSPIDATWFYVGTTDGSTTTSVGSDRYTSLSFRLQCLNNVIYSYYKSYHNTDSNLHELSSSSSSTSSSSSSWVQIGNALPLPPEFHDTPLQFGFRIKKEWNTYHHFEVKSRMLSGGPPLLIPTRSPTEAPTETRTWIVPETNYKPPACNSTDIYHSTTKTKVFANHHRHNEGSFPLYETRGIGGGGAMSGLSISPFNSLWFVGTDMGTLFRSIDEGQSWYPVSHYEAKYYSRLPVSSAVGFTSNSSTLLFSACHEDIVNRDCVAQRSIDAGLTWSPVNVTGNLTRVDHLGNPVLDYIPKEWVGSLIENSGLLFVYMFGNGKIYKSTNDGLDWNDITESLPFNTTHSAVGLYLDESTIPPTIYFGTTHGVYMWQDMAEHKAIEIWSPSTALSTTTEDDESILLRSFTGGRSPETGRLTLTFVDDDVSACNELSSIDCGYVHIYSTNITNTIELNNTDDISFIKSDQRGFRVAMSPLDGELIYVTGARSWPSARGTSVWVGKYNNVDDDFTTFDLKFLQSDVDNGYAKWPSDKLDYSAVGLDVGYWDGGYYTWGIHPKNSSIAGGSGNFFLHVTRDSGDTWESPFTEYADACNTNGNRIENRRWRSTGIEMTSVRWLQFNPHNTSYAFASVADIRMLRSDDGGKTWEITGGSGPLFSLNTVYDYAFGGPHTVFAVGGNFHDWPHEWYKNIIRGAGGVYVSFDSGDVWYRLGSQHSQNCNDDFLDTVCFDGDDMIRQILSIEYDAFLDDGTIFVGTQSAGVARLRGINPIMESGTIEQLSALQWEWINEGLGDNVNRIIPEIKLLYGNMYCLLTGDAPYYTNNDDVGIYQWNEIEEQWIHKRGAVIHHPDIGEVYDLWAYPVSFDVDEEGKLWLVDMEANWNYLASGIWKSNDDGSNWNRMKQYTFPLQVKTVEDRVYVSGERSISAIGNGGWGDGGMFHSDDEGITWTKNENIPLLANGCSMTIDPEDDTMLFYTFFGGGMLHGPVP